MASPMARESAGTHRSIGSDHRQARNGDSVSAGGQMRVAVRTGASAGGGSALRTAAAMADLVLFRPVHLGHRLPKLRVEEDRIVAEAAVHGGRLSDQTSAAVALIDQPSPMASTVT